MTQTNEEKAAFDRDGLLHEMPLVLSLLVTLAAVTSVGHDLTYFWMIGLEYLSILSTSDFLRGAITWMPPVLIFTGIMYYIDLSFPSKSPLVETYLAHGLSANNFRVYLQIIRNNKLPALASLTFPIWVLIAAPLYVGLSVVIWGAAILLITRRAMRAKTDLRSTPLRSAILALFLFGFGCIWGFSDAYTALRQTYSAYSLKTSDGPQRLVTIIRAIDKGVISKDGQLVSFHPWDNVEKLTKITNISEDRQKSTLLGAIVQWYRQTEPPAP